MPCCSSSPFSHSVSPLLPILFTPYISPHQVSISLIVPPIYSFARSNNFSLFHPVDKCQICIFSLPVSSPRIQPHSAQTRCWWRPPNITWRSVTHSCRTSTHSSTKPTPRGRPLFVPSCTSKSFKNVESMFSGPVRLDWAVVKFCEFRKWEFSSELPSNVDYYIYDSLKF